MDTAQDEEKPKSGRDAFRQQELPAWQPVLTPVVVIVMLLSVFVVFLPIGIVLEDASNQIVTQSLRYDNIPGCNVTIDMNYTNLPQQCTVEMNISDTMEPPIYFYYELENFYQNHRRYVESFSALQLRGGGDSEIDDCAPLSKYQGDTLLACGMIANSFFEDRFRASVYRDGALQQELCPSCINYGQNNSAAWHEHWDEWHEDGTWQMKGIAWESDLDQKFKNVNPGSSQTQVGTRQVVSGLRLPDMDNEDFVVWMRPAALPFFKKLHRIIKGVTLEPGDTLSVDILNWFPVHEFHGQKWITIATTKWCGSQNHALAWCYIMVACFSIGLTVIFAILLLFGKRNMADVDKFHWQNRPESQPLVSIT